MIAGDMERRSFLVGLAAAFAAPALVRAGSLEYVPRGLRLLPWPWVWRDGAPYIVPGEYHLPRGLIIPNGTVGAVAESSHFIIPKGTGLVASVNAKHWRVYNNIFTAEGPTNWWDNCMSLDDPGDISYNYSRSNIHEPSRSILSDEPTS